VATSQRARSTDTRAATPDQHGVTDDVQGDIPNVTDPDAQAVAIPDEVIDARPLNLSQEASARAAAWCQAKKYGPNMQRLTLYIASKAVSTADLNAVIMELMAERIFNAENPDDILDPFGTMKAEEILGKNILIKGCMFLDSTVGEGYPYYVSLDIEIPGTDQTKPLVVGGEKLVPMVAGFDMGDNWPQLLKIKKSDKQTQNGYNVLELGRPDL
jgi:hypothetical protein